MFSLSDRPMFWLTTAYLAVLAMQGGASRSNEPAQLIVRLAAVVLILLVLWRPRREQLRRHVPLAAFLAACAIVPLLQLIPLPPGVWQGLPGRAVYAAIESAAGLAPEWRPLSLTPDLTLDSFYALLPPVAVFLAAASLPPGDRRALALPCLVIALASAVIGLVQLGDGLGSFYRTGNKEGFAIGVFANRNHNAALLACAIPLTAVVIPRIARLAANRSLATILTVAIILFLAVMILLVGSRGGMIGGIIATLIAVSIARVGDPSRSRRTAGNPRQALRRGLVAGGLAAICGGAIWFALAQSRAVAWQRLVGGSSDEEIRLSRVGPLWDAAVTYFPFGSGQGSFRTVFERFEPFDQLRLTYANQAHNEPLQIVIESGLPGVLLAAILLWWLARHVWSAFRPVGGRGDAVATARAGAAIVVIAALASLVDYPLRTPLFGAVTVIACLWLSDARTAMGTRRGGNMVA